MSHTAKRGRRISEYKETDHRELLERPYRLIYWIDEDRQEVQIKTVMHYRQKLPIRPERKCH